MIIKTLVGWALHREELPVHLCPSCAKELEERWGMIMAPERVPGFTCTHCKVTTPADSYAGNSWMGGGTGKRQP